jgi:hypothetical protein|tara:strand:- start:481 stop:1041 length:561 start_codon:yes stop_codon:yes gene_type:complete
MDYSDRRFEYEDRNQARFRSLAIHISEQNVQEGTLEIISILEKEKQAAVRIYNQTEKLAYLEFIDREIERHKELLNLPSSTSQSSQSNEKLNTGKQTIEGIKSDNKKIQWTGTREELRSLFDLLYASALLVEGSDIPTLAQNHFYISGNKPIDNKSFAKVKRLKKDVSRETVEQFLECLREQEELK